MKPAEGLARLAFFLPFFAVWALFPRQGDRAADPALVYALVLAWARLGSFALGLRGPGEALAFAECLPFLAAGAAFYAGLWGAPLAVFCLLAASGTAALLALEELLLPRARLFVEALAFCAAASGSAALLSAALAGGAAGRSAFLGISLALAALAAYARARRPRAPTRH